MAKYRNRKVERDGIVFDSVKECQRYCELKLMQRAGVISDLQLQVPFELIPAQKVEFPDCIVKERAVTYVADFTYNGADGVRVVEDTKGYKTPEYIIKRKLMLWIHNIRIREI